MIILYVVGVFLVMLLFAVPWLNGLLDFYMGYRFQREAREGGAPADATAFWLNWNAFKWAWLHNAARIVKAMPFLQRDLTENFGIRPDDGRTT